MGQAKRELSARRISANKQNAKASTGPRTAEGKRRSRLNAVKAGGKSNSFSASLAALGEDVQEFERLTQELVSAYDPADAFWRKQVEDLAQLYWELDRERRVQVAVRQRELERLDEEERHRKIEMERGMYFGPAVETGGGGLVAAPDSAWKFEEMIFHLEELIVTVETRNFGVKKHPAHLDDVFGSSRAWYAVRIKRLFARLTPDEYLPNPHDEEAWHELRRMLNEAREQALADFERFKRGGAKISTAARNAALAPTSREWVMMMRRENTLTRAIDRKVRLLVDYAARGRKGIVPEQGSDRVRGSRNNADHADKKIISGTETSLAPARS